MVKNTIKQLIDLNNILIPFIEGLAKITEVDAKLALKADATAIPDVSDFITEAKAEGTYVKKNEVPSIEGLANKAEIESTYVKKSELQEKLENKANADQIPDVSLLVEKQK